MPGDILGKKQKLFPFNEGSKIVYYSLGRTALLNGVKMLANQKPGENELLVPAFICEETLWPLRDAGFKIAYYPIDKNFSFSLAEVETKINENTLAVMVVHYFGIPSDLKGLKELCSKKQVYLIEDCAHSFYGKKSGTIGDISFFSIRKFIPVPDGGALVVNNRVLQPKINQIISSRNTRKGQLIKLIMRAILNLLRDQLPIKKLNSIQKITIEELCSRADINEERSGFNPTEGMSDLSKEILSRQDLKAITAKRRENYNSLANMLKNIQGVVIPYPEAENGWSPYVLPVFVEMNAQIKAIKSLISHSIMATDWPTLPQDLPPEEKISAQTLMGRIILLPVHQHINKRTPEKIARAFRAALS